MEKIAFDLRKCISEMHERNKKVPDRNLSVAITNAETALMWLNRYVFSAIGQPGEPARPDAAGKVGPT